MAACSDAESVMSESDTDISSTEMPSAGLAGLLLVGGASSRLGSPKALLPCNGSTLLQLAIDRLNAVCDAGVTVVTGAHQAAIIELLQTNKSLATVIHNPRWAEGMSSSIGAGIDRLNSQPVKAALIMPVDLPHVSIADLASLREVWQNSPQAAVAAAYNGVLGIPAIFPRHWFAVLACLQGDRGARSLLQDHPDVAAVALPAAAIDIDTAADLGLLDD